MSQASDLIAEVKATLDKVEHEITGFEKDFADLGRFTDLAHLNIARVHLGELHSSLVNRRTNSEDAELAQMEADEATAEPVDEAEEKPAPRRKARA